MPLPTTIASQHHTDACASLQVDVGGTRVRCRPRRRVRCQPGTNLHCRQDALDLYRHIVCVAIDLAISQASAFQAARGVRTSALPRLHEYKNHQVVHARHVGVDMRRPTIMCMHVMLFHLGQRQRVQSARSTLRAAHHASSNSDTCSMSSSKSSSRCLLRPIRAAQALSRRPNDRRRGDICKNKNEFKIKLQPR